MHRLRESLQDLAAFKPNFSRAMCLMVVSDKQTQGLSRFSDRPRGTGLGAKIPFPGCKNFEASCSRSGKATTGTKFTKSGKGILAHHCRGGEPASTDPQQKHSKGQLDTKTEMQGRRGGGIVQGWAKRWSPGCVNPAQSQTEVVRKSRNKIHQIWSPPCCRALYKKPSIDASSQKMSSISVTMVLLRREILDS